jgi:hypothetical protein
MPEIGLDRSGIDPVIGQLKPTGVAEHVRVKFHIEASRHSGAFDQRLKSPFGKGRSTLANEYERRLGLSLQSPQSS